VLIDFAITRQDVKVMMEGKPAHLATESATQHINFDTEKSDDTSKPWTDRCGIPSMRFVVCDVDRATNDALTFHARTKTFVNVYAAEVPAPISVSTNVAYFNFPSIGVDTAANTKNLEVKTAAAHYLADGATLHEGNRLAHLRHRGEWGQGGFSEDFVLRAGTGPVLERTSLGEGQADLVACSDQARGLWSRLLANVGWL